ncbi:MAG: hypothetical protein EXS14_03050 [Planctomycetes bacterium]|nr:hypothetical protein [Planctomycetota bacterium]
MRILATLVLVTACCSVLSAQACPTASNTFWKRDTLPAIPGSSPLSLSVIQGLCEGEAAAVVFTLPVGMPPQKLSQVVAPFGAAGGANGFVAQLNVEVYDGVSWSGGLPNMGTQVFDLANSTGNAMQVTSTGLNTLDVSQYNIVVGNNPANRRFAIAFRLDFNPNGTCAAGYPANLFTDNATQFSLFCNPNITPTQTSLMYIIGQGWRDAATASVSGFQLCPIYYAGIWAIRACSFNAPPLNPLQVTSLSAMPVQTPGTAILQFIAPGFNGYPYVAALSFGTTGGLFTPFGQQVPLTPDPLFFWSVDPVASAGILLNFQGLVGSGGTGTALVNIPFGIGAQNLKVAFIALSPAPAPWGVSDPFSLLLQ